MSAARTIIVAGAGIGGLTAALALAQKGLRVALLDKAEKLEQTGAGIQLSPNATRVLIGLGLRAALLPSIVVPEAVVIRTARGRDVARLPLGKGAAARYGAPYWIIHRADLQAALLAAATAHPDITLTLGAAVEACATQSDGVAVQVRRGDGVSEMRGDALVGADGLWSRVRTLVGETDMPRFGRRAAWRALVPADRVAPELRAPAIQLWLGAGAHLVHYPVKTGAMINIVAIARDEAPSAGWSTAATPAEVLARFPRERWARAAHDVLSMPAQWLKWPLYDRAPRPLHRKGAVTLLGDAAHPMLPFVAQGAAMAIEDAAVLAALLAPVPDDLAAAMRRYEQARAPRTARVQRVARRNDTIYHLAWPASALRDLAMGGLGNARLRGQHDWIYGWRPD
ncbi:MAG TPA: FAD-dependent monooxygenase [Xanthobacteraceae bacterium]